MGPTRLAKRIADKNLGAWLPGWLRDRPRRLREGAGAGRGLRHLLFAFCDHYEPLWGDVSDQVGRDRVRAWMEGYPRLAERFRDADGKPPRHSFFFPGEQYRPEFLEDLASLSRRGYGEVELHLHHDADSADGLRRDIDSYLAAFAEHGHLARLDGRLRYAFIHGNWCLANARKDRRYCGVDEEVQLLWDTGCYADFTFPAAPNESQPPIVNQIYWPRGDLSGRRAQDRGERARVGAVKDDRILIVEGPLSPALRDGRLSVRIENGDLHGADPPTPRRVRTWVSQHICVAGRPEWVFVKVHTHGAPEKNAPAILGDGGETLHRVLQEEFNDGVRWKLHYVTAREMYNVALAAMHGAGGDPDLARDFHLPPPPACS